LHQSYPYCSSFIIDLYECYLAFSELLLTLGLTSQLCPLDISSSNLHNRVRFPNNSIYPVRCVGVILHKLFSKPFLKSPILRNIKIIIFEPLITTSFLPFLTSSWKQYLHSILSQIRSKALWRALTYHVISPQTLSSLRYRICPHKLKDLANLLRLQQNRSIK
jgi:hypothetical protein